MRKNDLKRLCIKIRRYWKGVGVRVKKKEVDDIKCGKYDEVLIKEG